MPLGNAGARDLLDRWDRLRIRLEDFEGPVDLTGNVSPDEATRAAAEACESQTTRFETELYQNGALYARIKALTARTGPAAKMRKDLLDTFEDNGAALDPDKRALLVLHYLQHESVATIAATMHIPGGTVKWRLHAARGALERALRAQGEGRR